MSITNTLGINYILGFPMGRDSATFRDRSSFIVMGQKDNGTSKKSCQGPGRARTNQSLDGTSRNSQNLGQDKTGHSRKGRSKTRKDVLKQENNVLKQEIWSFF